jgi:hypothetical protein
MVGTCEYTQGLRLEWILQNSEFTKHIKIIFEADHTFSQLRIPYHEYDTTRNKLNEVSSMGYLFEACCTIMGCNVNSSSCLTT